ncbi:hypothetical protein MNBD_GAMMA13-1251, partial [hydrothermal vent metagenome]
MMKITLKNTLCFVTTFTLAMVSGSSLAVSQGPHWLEARALDKQTGKPLADTAICLGTTARPDQFGARRTDHSGVVRFEDVLPTSLVLTASRSGYKGKKQLLEPLHQSRVLILKLVTGGGGPVCNAELSSQNDGVIAGLEINTVNLSRDVGVENGVQVAVTASGAINQIRISEQPNFSGAAWQPYQESVPYT